MAKILLVNCSSRYNLGLAKAEAYHRARGDEVTWADRVDLLAIGADVVYLSALFTWDLPALVENARRACDMGLQVEVGGPAVTVMAGWVEEKTGLLVHRGLRPEWEGVPGSYRATFTTRGCIRHCPFCAVPRLEPEFQVIEDFTPAPLVLDNNILAAGLRAKGLSPGEAISRVGVWLIQHGG